MPRWSPERTQRVPNHPTAYGNVSLLALDVAVSYVLLQGRLEAGPTVGLDVGSMRGVGYGVTNPGAGSAAWVAPWAGATMVLRTAELLSLRLEVAAIVPIAARTFRLEGAGVVHTPAAVAGRLVLGAEVRFP
jgi:hypothetical protein